LDFIGNPEIVNTGHLFQKVLIFGLPAYHQGSSGTASLIR
jgi:hypothetical protein